MKKTGCKKPIFYNISHSIHLSDAYFSSEINGGTFQWYPTGLGAGHELRGNFLPNTDQYTIPFANHPKFKSMAKMVYEFDAADIGRSYIYPAIARSFREAGIQWATHFAYDPTFMANTNTEYNTHYMNLAYAPQKALSLKIASEVFRNVPMYKTFGRYPDNTTFDSFHVSYPDDLAEMATDEKFIYTNNTQTRPPHPELLETISGFGNSSVVTYEGRGAYFLDQIEKGVWRLEVMPDAIWIDNIFGRNSLKKEVAVINWRTWQMNVSLPDLGNDFKVTSLTGNVLPFKSSGNSFNINPGVYLLCRDGVTAKSKGTDKWKNIILSEFAAPTSSVKKTYLLHTPFEEVVENTSLKISASVITKEEPESVLLHVITPSARKVMSMNHTKAYNYEAIVPAEIIHRGYVSYYITVNQNGASQTFPSGIVASPDQWDFYDNQSYKVPVVSKSNSIYLFNAFTDSDEISKEWRRGSMTLPGCDPNTAELIVKVPELSKIDEENLNGPQIVDYSLRYNFSNKIKGRANELDQFHKLIVKAATLAAKSFPLQIAVITKEGDAYGGLITLDDLVLKEYTLNISDLKPVRFVTLPRPYPGFLNYYFEGILSTKPLEVKNIETIQISVGPGIDGASLKNDFSFVLESVRME